MLFVLCCDRHIGDLDKERICAKVKIADLFTVPGSVLMCAGKRHENGFVCGKSQHLVIDLLHALCRSSAVELFDKVRAAVHGECHFRKHRIAIVSGFMLVIVRNGS